MSKKIIAVDMDDVLFDEHQSIRQFINEMYNLQLSVKDYDIEGPYWGYWETVWNVGEKGKEWYKSYIDSGVKKESTLVSGAIEAINKLEQWYELVVITSREATAVDLTRQWLEEHFPGMFTRVEFVAIRGLHQKASKAVIAEELGASYLIDDSLHHCESVAKVGVHALLFGDHGYSRAYKGGDPLITRVQNWKKVEEFFDAGRR